MTEKEKMAEQIIKKTLEFGADLAGLADLTDLVKSPSSVIYEQLGGWVGVGSVTVDNNREDADILKEKTKYRIKWPQDAKTMVVIAVRHPENEPALDWWQRDAQPGGTMGNLRLIRVLNRLAKWLEQEKGIRPTKIPYVIEDGGIFLKDAAAWAGIGVVGKNNMMVTPQYGPRVRLRALSLPVELGSTGLLDFDPCDGCLMPCRTACPEQSFAEQVYSSPKYNLDILPGREGAYSRIKCNIQMSKDVDNAEALTVEVESIQKETKRVHYCRRCEFACPVGHGK